MTNRNNLLTTAIATLALSACGGAPKEPAPASQASFEASPERVAPPVSDDVASEATTPILPQDVVYFALDSATLSEVAQRDLTTVATWMLDHPQRYVVIEAHTDEQGSDAHNIDLSKRRGLAVLNQLIKNGADRKLVILTALGESEAIDGSNAVNRRALIYATESPLDKPAT